MSLSAKGQQQKYVRQLQHREQCIGHIAYYLSGLSRAYFFPTTFLEIAVYIAISRKAVGENVHATIPKVNMGYDQ